MAIPQVVISFVANKGIVLNMQSLDVFTEKYSGRIWKRYLVYTKDMSKDQDIFCGSIYMVLFL